MTTTTNSKPCEPTLGQLCYETWCSQIGSNALPTWEQLGEPVRQAWYEASIAVVEWSWKKQHRLLMRRRKKQESLAKLAAENVSIR